MAFTIGRYFAIICITTILFGVSQFEVSAVPAGIDLGLDLGLLNAKCSIQTIKVCSLLQTLRTLLTSVTIPEIIPSAIPNMPFQFPMPTGSSAAPPTVPPLLRLNLNEVLGNLTTILNCTHIPL